MKDLMFEMAKQEESILIEQLSDLINDGVIVIHRLQPVLTKTETTDGKVILKMESAVRLTFKGREEMDKLKDRIELLEELLRQERNREYG